MKDRIKLIMDSEHLTPSAFADKLQVGRAVISHILNGRNNPSLEIVTRIINRINYINPEWLLSGTGTMYKIDSTKNQENTNRQTDVFNQPDLFAQNLISSPPSQIESENRRDLIVEQPVKQDEIPNNQQIIYQKAPDRKISKIIIYYTDNTFETFNADNKPL